MCAACARRVRGVCAARARRGREAGQAARACVHVHLVHGAPYSSMPPRRTQLSESTFSAMLSSSTRTSEGPRCRAHERQNPVTALPYAATSPQPGCAQRGRTGGRLAGAAASPCGSDPSRTCTESGRLSRRARGSIGSADHVRSKRPSARGSCSSAQRLPGKLQAVTSSDTVFWLWSSSPARTPSSYRRNASCRVCIMSTSDMACCAAFELPALAWPSLLFRA